MAVYNSLESVHRRSAEAIRSVLTDGEQVILIGHQDPRFIPSFISKFSPYHILTDRRFIELQLLGRTKKYTDIELSSVTQTEYSPNPVTGRGELELSGSGIDESFTLLRDQGEALSSELRDQLAKKESA